VGGMLKNEGDGVFFLNLPLRSLHCKLACSWIRHHNGTHYMIRSEIVLTGGYSEYHALYDCIFSIAEREGYSNVFTADLQLSIKEAFVNAVKHGNREKSDLTVTFSFVIATNSLTVSVRDCGKGFKPDDLPSPASPWGQLKQSGRGVHIIRSVAEIISLERDNDGSTLMLRYIPY